MMKLSFALLLNLISVCTIFGQPSDSIIYLKVGEPMPDVVVHNIKYYPRKEEYLSGFKGKWLVLEFWSQWCSTCRDVMPRVNQIEKELGNRVQVLSVGIPNRVEKPGELEALYEKYRYLEHLIMPCAFDSSLAKRFGIEGLPHSFIIDDKGIVRYNISTFVDLSDMKDILNGENPPLLNADSPAISPHPRIPFNPTKPFLIGQNGGNDTDFTFRSILSKWNKAQERYVPSQCEDVKHPGVFQVLGVPLSFLYNYAYFGVPDWGSGDSLRYGNYYKTPILFIHDLGAFYYNYRRSTGIYNYSLMMPSSEYEKGAIQNALQRDLVTYFGFKAAVEVRKCPYWKLVATKEAASALKRNRRLGKEPIYTGLALHDQPFSTLLNWIKGPHPDEVFLDETGIDGNVTIAMDCMPFDLEDVRQSLKKYGLDLIKAEKNMKVVVIRE